MTNGRQWTQILNSNSQFQVTSTWIINTRTVTQLNEEIRQVHILRPLSKSFANHRTPKRYTGSTIRITSNKGTGQNRRWLQWILLPMLSVLGVMDSKHKNRTHKRYERQVHARQVYQTICAALPSSLHLRYSCYNGCHIRLRIPQ